MTSAVENRSIVEESDTDSSIIKGLFKGALIGVMIVCLAFVVAVLAVPRVIGAVPLTVLTGSMAPTFEPGDLIVTMPVEDAKNEVKRGDIITFQPESGVGTLVTHRVVSVGFTLGGKSLFTTRGDANDSEDEPILEEQVMGKYLYHIPYLGYVANAIPNDTKPVMIQVLGIAILGWAAIQSLIIVISSIRRKRKTAE